MLVQVSLESDDVVVGALCIPLIVLAWRRRTGETRGPAGKGGEKGGGGGCKCSKHILFGVRFS
jgi:hypothetical protein